MNEDDTVLIWDVIQNVEFQIYDVHKPYEILFDLMGSPYVVTNNLIYFGE